MQLTLDRPPPLKQLRPSTFIKQRDLKPKNKKKESAHRGKDQPFPKIRIET